MSFKSGFVKALLGVDKALAEVNPLFGLAAPLITAIQPNSATAVTKIATGIDQLGLIVAQAEAVRQTLGLSGADAAKVAAPQVAQLFLNSLLLAGKHPKDEALFKAQTTQLIGIVNDIYENFD